MPQAAAEEQEVKLYGMQVIHIFRATPAPPVLKAVLRSALLLPGILFRVLLTHGLPEADFVMDIRRAGLRTATAIARVVTAEAVVLIARAVTQDHVVVIV